jgi:hypothetical protein
MEVFNCDRSNAGQNKFSAYEIFPALMSPRLFAE